MRHQLQNDRRRDVRHDSQRKDRKALQRAPREHVKHAQNAALLAAEQIAKRFWINSRNRNVCPDPINNQCAEQEEKPALKIAVLSALADLS